MTRSKKRKLMAGLTAMSAAAVLMVASPAWAQSGTGTGSDTATVTGNTNNADNGDSFSRSTLKNTQSGKTAQGAIGNVNAGQNNGSNNQIQQSISVGVDQGPGSSAIGTVDASSSNGATVNTNKNTLGGYDSGGTMKTDSGQTLTNTIMNSSFSGASGNVNDVQNNGSNNAMGQNTSVGVSLSSASASSLNASASASNTMTGSSNTNTVTDSPLSNMMQDNSFQKAAGNINAQQNNGANNAIQQATAVGYVGGPVSGFSSIGASSNSATLTNNTSTIDGKLDDPSNMIKGFSFQGVAGDVNVQQNNGANNALQQSTAVGISTSPPGTPATTAPPIVDPNVSNIGSTTKSTSIVIPSMMTNTLQNSSFAGATGQINVQQNNGANNVLQQATAVDVVGGSYSGVFAPMSMAQTATVTSDTNSVSSSPLSNSIQNSSFDGAKGNINVQQDNGSNNVDQQGIEVGVNSAVSSLIAATSSSTLSGTVSGNSATLTNVALTNTLSGNAFQKATGNMNISQNNGSNGSIQQSISVAVH